MRTQAFFKMAVEYKKKIGATFQFLIEPKPREPMKHQYDYGNARAFSPPISALTIVGLHSHNLSKEYTQFGQGTHTSWARALAVH